MFRISFRYVAGRSYVKTKHNDKKYFIPKKGQAPQIKGEKTIKYNLNEAIKPEESPYASSCANRCNLCGIPISKRLFIWTE